jgi:hypothetical protein
VKTIFCVCRDNAKFVIFRGLLFVRRLNIFLLENSFIENGLRPRLSARTVEAARSIKKRLTYRKLVLFPADFQIVKHILGGDEFLPVNRIDIHGFREYPRRQLIIVKIETQQNVTLFIGHQTIVINPIPARDQLEIFRFVRLIAVFEIDPSPAFQSFIHTVFRIFFKARRRERV